MKHDNNEDNLFIVNEDSQVNSPSITLISYNIAKATSIIYKRQSSFLFTMNYLLNKFVNAFHSFSLYIPDDLLVFSAFSFDLNL